MAEQNKDLFDSEYEEQKKLIMFFNMIFEWNKKERESNKLEKVS